MINTRNGQEGQKIEEIRREENMGMKENNTKVKKIGQTKQGER
jgi:hypothetical protein